MTVPGLQPERTRLAWRRSVLAAGIPTLLLGRIAVENRAPGVAVAGAVLWLAFALAAQRRIHAMADPRPAAPPPGVAWIAAGLVAAFGLVCVYSLVH